MRFFYYICSFWFIFYVHFVVILNSHCASAFSNFLGEIFNDLRFGTLDTNYLKEKFDYKKLKCLQGSYSFNGSCYFISNKKYSDSSYETELLVETLMKLRKNNKKSSVSSLDSTPLGTAAELASLPTDSSWKSAFNYCAQLNNDSSLIFFDNNNLDEYEFILSLLKRLNFPSLAFGTKQANENILSDKAAFVEEQKYFIGLTFNNSVWTWINKLNLSQELIRRFKLENMREDPYRKCSYLNLRDNGDVSIELSNCFNEKQPYICKYILDRCYNNTSCGADGECINLPHKKSFECKCRLFYDGNKCQKWSNQGIQMLIAASLVILAFIAVFMIKILNEIRIKLDERKERLNKLKKSSQIYFNSNGNQYVTNPLLPRKSSVIKNRYSVQKFKLNLTKMLCVLLRKKLKLILITIISLIMSIGIIFLVSYTRYKMIEYKIKAFKINLKTQPNRNVDIKDIDKDDESSTYFTKFFHIDLCKSMKDQFLEDYIIIYFSLIITGFIYFWNSFKCNRNHENFCKFGDSKSRNYKEEHDVSSIKFYSDQNIDKTKCPSDENIRTRRWMDLVRRFFNLRKLRKFTFCGVLCTCGIEFPVPMNPFSKRNRFITGIVYAAYTYNILKIFEYLLIGDQYFEAIGSFKNSLGNLSLSSITNSTLTNIKELHQYAERGILMDLLKQICNVFIIGLRYYPVLLCVELKRKSKLCYFICTIYVLSLFSYYVYMNIFCLISAFEAIKEANNLKSNPIDFSFTNTISARMIKPTFSNASNSKSVIKPQNASLFQSIRSSFNRSKRSLVYEPRVNHSSIPFSHNLINLNQKDQLKVENTINVNQIRIHQTNLTEELLSISDSTFYNNIMYEKFIFYAVLCLITSNMVAEFGLLVLKSNQRKKEKCRCKACGCKESKNKASNEIEHDESNSEHKLLKSSQHSTHKYLFGKCENEILYTVNLFNNSSRQKPVSFVKYYFEKYVYENRRYFRYSKQFINTHIIAFVLLYYISSIIIRKSNKIVSLSSNLLILIINFIFKMNSSSEFGMNSNVQIKLLIESLYQNINMYITIACLFTTGIYVLQLLLGIKNYHKHVLNAYKGVYIDIPPPSSFSSTKLTSSSLHHSGYAIGYLLWGYLILFEVTVVVIIIIKFLIKFYFITENLAKIFLPILTIYLFKKIIIWYLCHYFLTNKSQNKHSLRNHKLYFLLNHFNFFFDCFLGSFVCFLRMAKSSMAALFFMPRLDYSIFGRYLEKTDMGFISYVTFIHMEVNQTHPIKIAFCEYLNRSLDEKELYRKHNKETIILTREETVTFKKYRNKWLVFNMLRKYPQLRKERKRYLYLQSLVPKVETFGHFLERRVKNLFQNNQTKKKSRSTPDILSELQKEALNQELRTSTIDYRINRGRLPPIPAPRNMMPIYSRNIPFEDSNDSSDNTMIQNLSQTLNNTSLSSTSQYFSYNTNQNF